jgi:hypothetical protein
MEDLKLKTPKPKLWDEGPMFFFWEGVNRLYYLICPPTLKMSPLETRLYAEAVRKLPPDAAARVERQMAEYNLVQRDGYKKMTHFYSIKRGKEGFPDALCFPEREENFKFASIKFRVPDCDTEFKANFWGMCGRFFRITFNNTIADIMHRNDIEIVKTTVTPAGLV